MNHTADIVIVGAGIVGVSLAYHLAQMSTKQVLVIDKGELFDNDGSTSHAPGGVTPLGGSEAITQLGAYSVQLYGQLSQWKSGRNPVNKVGGIELARTPERLEVLKRICSLSKSWGVETYMITPEEIADRFPLMRAEVFRGGLFIPQKVNASGVQISGALGRLAEEKGNVTFVGHTRMLDFIKQGNRICGVTTNNPDMPTIHAEEVVLCTNIWSPALSEKVGFTLPLMAAEHQYVLTTPVRELEPFSDMSDPDKEVVYPTTRDIDRGMYYKHYWNHIGIGSYYHKPRMVRSQDLGVHGESAMHPFTPEDFEEAWQITCDTMPCLRPAGISKAFNGMFSFSVDGNPMLGPTSVPGLWVGAAVWLGAGAGAGKTVAEWLLTGETEVDTRALDVRRFLPYQLTERYITIASTKSYAEVYDIVHPAQTPSTPRQVRHTPCAARQQTLEAHHTVVAGLELPLYYHSNAALLHTYNSVPERSGWDAQYWSPIQGAEHLAVRHHAGLFDLSTLGIIEIQGEQATQFMNTLCTNQLDVPLGHVVYTLLCTPKGGIKRDVSVARLGAERYWLFSGQATLPLELAWITQHAPQHLSIRDLSTSYSGLGLWGPQAHTILEKTTSAPLDNDAFPFYTARWLDIGMARVFAMRISYAGELGWELYTTPDMALHVWDTLWEAGKEQRLIAAGAGALRSLRLEKGYRMWGSDIHTGHNPYEAGLGWTVKLGKAEDFIGKAALTALKGPQPRKQVMLSSDNPQLVLMGDEPVMFQGEVIGHVTSGNYGYSLGKYLAFAYVRSAYSKRGTELQVEHFNALYPVTVTATTPFDPDNARLKGLQPVGQP